MAQRANRPHLVWDHQTANKDTVTKLLSETTLDPVVAQLLVLRGITEPEEVKGFLYPDLAHLHDPFSLQDLPLAVDRLQQAITRGERIAIHGDYDVDGVTSTVILRRMLDLLGADAIHFIPDRLRDGYGLEPTAVDSLAAQHVRVIVSADCGIRSHEAAIRARELGVDLIVTDHHEPQGTLPPAKAVINPKRPDCSYPDKNLAGVGVALKLVQALCERTNHPKWLSGFIKLAALGTIADIVPLRGENRVIAKLGLEHLSGTRHAVGLRALLESTGLLGQTVTSFHVAFRLAPRINAAGRMSSPDLASKLLLLTDEKSTAEAETLAATLEGENERRQEEEAEILSEARRQVETNPSIGAHAMVVVWGNNWHRGVIGIVASKLVELFHRPAIVLAIDDDVAYGSGRSIPNFDLLGALEGCADLFTRFGGHRHAAGMTIPTQQLKSLRHRLTKMADETLEPDDLVPRLRVDCHLPLTAINKKLVEGLRLMEPFGAGNPRPMFYTGPVELAQPLKVIKEQHLALSVRQGKRLFRAIGWRMADRAEFVRKNANSLNLAFNLSENFFRGQHTVELSLADIRAGG